MKIQKISIIKSTAVPLSIENIDTDQMVPARFLKATTKEGFGENLFRDWRFNSDGSKKSDFILNNPRYRGRILVAGKNFGSGSSREHATWALTDYGFQAVISSFFADIFKSNALNNSLLPITVSDAILGKLLAYIFDHPSTAISIDLPNQTLSVPVLNIKERFDINPYKKNCMMNGYSDMDYLLSQRATIEEYEKKHSSSSW